MPGDEVPPFEGPDADVAAILSRVPYVALYQIVRRPDGQTYFTYFGDGIRDILGISPSEIYAQPTLLGDLAIAADIPRLLSAWEVSIQQMVPFQVVVRQQSRTLGMRYSLLRSSPRRDSDGSIIWDGIQIDVTSQLAGLALPPADESLHFRVCAWCTRYFGPDGQWHPNTGLLNVFSANRVTHGMCPGCKAQFLRDDKWPNP